MPGRTRVPLPVPVRVTSARQAWLHAQGRDDAGFTLVEVLVAFVVLLIVLVPVASLLANSIGQAATSRERLTALSLAEQYIETLNNSGPHLKATGQPNLDTTVTETPAALVRSGVAYTVKSRFTWAPAEGSHPDLCTSGSSPKVMDLEVTVSWSHTTHDVTDSTIVNYPPAGLPTKGFLAVQLNGDPASSPPSDAKGVGWTTRVKAVPVTVQTPPAPATPTYSTTVEPDSYGCVFLQVTSGTYSVKVASPSTTPAWVANADEATSQTKSPYTVSIGQVTTATFQYDQGSLVDVQYPSTTAVDGGVACPDVGKILCLAAGQSPASSSHPATTPVAVLSVRTTTSANWSLQRPSGMTRVATVACAGTVRCIVVGSHLTTYTSGTSSGAAVSAAPGATPPSFAADTLPSGVTALSTLTCPSATTCYATGLGSAGPVLLVAAVASGGDTWTADVLPAGTSALGTPSCASATVCSVPATVSTAAAILSLSPPAATGKPATTWPADTLPATPKITAVRAVDCPAATTCYATAVSGTTPEILSLGSSTTTGGTTSGSGTAAVPTWQADAVTAPTGVAVTSVGQLACPSSTTCYAAGEQRSGTTTAGALLSLTGATAWTVDSIVATTATTGITQVGCSSTAACIALASTSKGPAILRPSAGSSWAAATMPSGMTVDSLSDAVCTTASHCVATGTATSSGRTSAVVLHLGSGTKWTVTSTGAAQVDFFTGVACAGPTCVAPGATGSGAVYYGGAPTATAWSGQTPASTPAGLAVEGVPVSVANPNLQSASTLLVTAPASDATTIGPLFPFSSGYSVGAAECSSEMTTASASVTSVPGATSSPVTLPMGLLPVKVSTAKGVPVSGAALTVTLLTKTGKNAPTVPATKRGSCQPLTPLSGGSAPATYTLERTGGLGQSAIDVVYDTYLLTVTAPDGHTATRRVQVTPTATVVTGTTPRPLPAPVKVTVT